MWSLPFEFVKRRDYCKTAAADELRVTGTMFVSSGKNTPVSAARYKSSRNLTDEIWSPAKLLSLGSDYNGV
jgi:valyl-tRNA synthetase